MVWFTRGFFFNICSILNFWPSLCTVPQKGSLCMLLPLSSSRPLLFCLSVIPCRYYVPESWGRSFSVILFTLSCRSDPSRYFHPCFKYIGFCFIPFPQHHWVFINDLGHQVLFLSLKQHKPSISYNIQGRMTCVFPPTALTSSGIHHKAYIFSSLV